jgi:hypothetical protein
MLPLSVSLALSNPICPGALNAGFFDIEAFDTTLYSDPRVAVVRRSWRWSESQVTPSGLCWIRHIR